MCSFPCLSPWGESNQLCGEERHRESCCVQCRSMYWPLHVLQGSLSASAVDAGAQMWGKRCVIHVHEDSSRYRETTFLACSLPWRGFPHEFGDVQACGEPAAGSPRDPITLLFWTSSWVSFVAVSWTGGCFWATYCSFFWSL